MEANYHFVGKNRSKFRVESFSDKSSSLLFIMLFTHFLGHNLLLIYLQSVAGLPLAMMLCSKKVHQLVIASFKALAAVLK